MAYTESAVSTNSSPTIRSKTIAGNEPESNPNGKSPERCPECIGQLITRDKQKYCQSCGLIVDESLYSREAEWRSRRSEDKSGHNLVRCNGRGRDPTHHDFGLGSLISAEKTNTRKMQRLRRWHKQEKAPENSDRSLRFALGEIKRVSSSLELSKDIEERASSLFRRAQKKDLLDGQKIERIVAATIYIACREQSIAKLPDEIGRASRLVGDALEGDNTPKKEVMHGYSLLCRNLEIKILPLSPVDYIPRICSELDVSDSVRHNALRLARYTESHQQFTGNSPSGLVAGCVQYASERLDANYMQKEIAEAVGVSPYTVRNIYQILRDDPDTPHIVSKLSNSAR